MKIIQLSTPLGIQHKITFKFKSELLFYNLSEIICCKAERNYTRFFILGGKEHLCCKNISALAKELKPYGFLQVNKSYMVNSMYISSITSGDKLCMKLVNDMEITVSGSKKDIIKSISGFDK